MSKWRMRHKRANLHSTAHPQREIAEERFHTLARGWLAYPVTPAAHATTAEERLQKYHRHVFSEIADAKLLAKIYPVIYTTALRR